MLPSLLVNLSLGVYLRASLVKWRAYAQAGGSLRLLAATFWIVAAFFFESKAALERPSPLLSMVLFLAGAWLHVLATMRHQTKDS